MLGGLLLGSWLASEAISKTSIRPHPTGVLLEGSQLQSGVVLAQVVPFARYLQALLCANLLRFMNEGTLGAQASATTGQGSLGPAHAWAWVQWPEPDKCIPKLRW